MINTCFECEHYVKCLRNHITDQPIVCYKDNHIILKHIKETKIKIEEEDDDVIICR